MSGSGARKAHPREGGAGIPETSALRGTEEQGCLERVPNVGPGTAEVCLCGGGVPGVRGDGGEKIRESNMLPIHTIRYYLPSHLFPNIPGYFRGFCDLRFSTEELVQ